MSAEHKLRVNGRRAPREEAYAHWLASATYRNANHRTRAGIWPTVMNGDANGNNDSHGEVNHLREAGIEIFP